MLDKLKIHPSKKLGQNFLVDDNLLGFIARSANPRKGELIIEIGPGLGALTNHLLNSEADVIAVEYDSRLAEYLNETIHSSNFRLIHQDACRLNFNEIIPKDKPYRIIANLPYSITTPLIASFLKIPEPPADMLFLLQKETAERLNATPNTKSYGSITVLVQNVYNIEYLRTVTPDVFYPKPIVNSAIVRFIKKQDIQRLKDRKLLSTIVRTAFSKRRKKMINNLQPILKDINLHKIFAKLAIDKNTRAEELSPEEFLELAKSISHSDNPESPL